MLATTPVLTLLRVCVRTRAYARVPLANSQPLALLDHVPLDPPYTGGGLSYGAHIRTRTFAASPVPPPMPPRLLKGSSCICLLSR